MLYHWLYQQVFDTPPLKSIEVALIYRTGEGVVRLLIVVVPSPFLLMLVGLASSFNK